MPLILASASPRRQQLLTESGIVFDTILPENNAEDSRLPNENPLDYVCRLALQKAQSVAEKIEHGIILGCDTVVLCGDSILEKPVDRSDARKMLRQLCGKKHSVLSGLCLIKKTAGRESAVCQETESTQLFMSPISDEQIESYLDTGHWQGKAGGFGYQDENNWITVLEGSISNVVGLPMELFCRMYKQI